MRGRLRRTLFVFAGLAATVGWFAGIVLTGSAQTATVTGIATSSSGTTTSLTPTPGTYPVDLHTGTCQSPSAKPAFSLGHAGPPIGSNGHVLKTEGIQSGPPLLEAAAQPKFKLTDLLTSHQQYVVLVHQSDQAYTTYLACGALYGPIVNNQLAVALRPINNAPYAGLTTFHENGDTTSVTTYLITELTALTGGKVSGTATPQPTPPGATSQFTPTVAPTPPAPTATPPPTPATVVSVTRTTTTTVQVTATPKPTP